MSIYCLCNHLALDHHNGEGACCECDCTVFEEDPVYPLWSDSMTTPPCLRCAAPSTIQTADTDEPLCWVHSDFEPDCDLPWLDRDFNLDEAEEE